MNFTTFRKKGTRQDLQSLQDKTAAFRRRIADSALSQRLEIPEPSIGEGSDKKNNASIDAPRDDVEPINVCPSSSQQFRGLCPVVTCPANVSQIPDRKPGCALLLFNTADLDKFRLAHAFKRDPKIVAEQIETGKRRIKRVLLFAAIMEKHVSTPQHQCSKCFVQRPSKSDCLNVGKCKERQELAKHLLKKFPFNQPMLKMTPARLFAFAASLKTVNAALAQLAAKTSTPISELIGVGPNALKSLSDLSGVPSPSQLKGTSSVH